MRSPAVSGRHVIVAEFAFGDAFPLRHNWSQRKHGSMLDYVGRVVERVVDDTGDVVDLSAESMTATFGDDELAAASSMIVIQEWLLDEVGEAGTLARIGVAMGQLSVHEVDPIGQVVVAGPAAARARALAERATSGAVLLDATVAQGLVTEFLSSRAGKARGWSGRDYLSAVAEARGGHELEPIAFHELLWNGRTYGVRADQPNSDPPARADDLTRATVEGANEQGSTLLVRADGELFHVDGSDVVGAKPLAHGDAAYFVGEVKGPVPRARDVIPLGSGLTARVKKVFSDRGYAFVDVAGHDVFLHADHNTWPLEVGDIVRFTASENERGLIAIDGKPVAS